MNQLILVGRIAKDLEIEEKEQKKKTILTLAISRDYRNTNGEYETDFIPCILWNGIAERTTEYCRKGDVAGIKGKLQSSKNGIYVVADKVTFISSKKNEEEE